MNPYKEKCLEYVRKQIPELMELSFGCEVEIDGVKQKVGGGVQLNDAGTERYFEGCGCCGGYLDCETKIIGHPIQLHHWLRVLKVDEMMISEDILRLFFYSDYLELESKLDFNLTTGQPTEDSWKPLWELLGKE